MLWLLFPLLPAVVVAIGVALPTEAIAGYAAVIAWVAIMLYLIFYRKETVSRIVEDLNRQDAKRQETP